MDVWWMIQERYILLSVLLMIILVNLLLLLATWKKQADLPKSLTVIITAICLIMMILSILTLVFIVSFGYNTALSTIIYLNASST